MTIKVRERTHGGFLSQADNPHRDRKHRGDTPAKAKVGGERGFNWVADAVLHVCESLRVREWTRRVLREHSGGVKRKNRRHVDRVSVVYYRTDHLRYIRQGRGAGRSLSGATHKVWNLSDNPSILASGKEDAITTNDRLFWGSHTALLPQPSRCIRGKPLCVLARALSPAKHDVGVCLFSP